MRMRREGTDFEALKLLRTFLGGPPAAYIVVGCGGAGARPPTDMPPSAAPIAWERPGTVDPADRA